MTVAQSENISVPWVKSAGLAVGLLLITVALFFATWQDMVNIWWNSSTFNHCFLIFPISGYLVWQLRDQLLDTPMVPARLALLALAACCLLWLVGDLAGINLFTHVAVVAMIPAIVWLAFGWRVFWLLLFPLGYLFFAVPFGEFLVPKLQDLTAVFTVWALKLTGMPVFMEGRYISIPAGDFVVAEACSGINYLIASVALGALYAYLQYHSVWRRVAFMALAVLIPILANCIRAYGIIMIAHASDMKYAVGFDHLIYGWVFFGVVIFFLFWLGGLFAQKPQAITGSTLDQRGQAATPFSQWLLAAVPAVLLLAGTAVLAQVNLSPTASVAEFSLPELQQSQAQPLAESSDKLLGGRYQQATRLIQAEYDGAQNWLGISVALFDAQTQGGELINANHRRYNDDWQRLAEGQVTHQGQNYRWIQVRDQRQREWLLLSWYELGDQSTTNPLTVKLTELKRRLLLQSTLGAEVIVYAPISASRQAELQQLLQQAQALRAPIAAQIAQLRSEATHD